MIGAPYARVERHDVYQAECARTARFFRAELERIPQHSERFTPPLPED